MSDIRWLSYAEVATALGIGVESAKNLVRRKRWSRKPGNDGLMRIGVPLEHLADRKPDPPADRPIDPPSNPPADDPIDGATVVALEGHITTLKEIVDRERERADAERARADDERTRADGLAAELNQARTIGAERVADIEVRLAELRDLINSSRNPRPWWRRFAG